MNIAKKFIHSVPSLFKLDIKREQAKLAKIEKKRQAREARAQVISRYAALRDNLMAAGKNSDFKASEIDRLATWPRGEIFQQFISGRIPVEELATRLLQCETVNKYADQIKLEIHKFFVEPAEIKLAEFEKQNAVALRGVKLEQAPEPEFVPASPAREW